MDLTIPSTPAVTTTTPASEPTAPTTATEPTGAAPPAGATGATGAAEPKPAPEERAHKVFAAIAQRERGVRSGEARVKAEAARIEQERASLKADREAAEAYRRELAEMQRDPLGFLQKHAGLDYETLTRRHVLRQPDPQDTTPKPAPDPRVEAHEKELAEWRKEREERAKAVEDAKVQEQKASYLKVIADEKAAKIEYCKQHADDFEMVLADPDAATDLYLGLYAQAYQEAGRELEPDEQIAILKRAEELLTERESQRLDRLKTSKRFGSRFASPPKEQPASPDVPTGAPKPPTPQGAEQKTLTNGLTSSPPPIRYASTAGKSIDEVHAEALARVAARFPVSR
jgi:hypothetical protein